MLTWDVKQQNKQRSLLIRDIDTVCIGWSILSFKGNRSTFRNYHSDEFISFFFTLANSTDPDKQLPYAAFHLGLHCL